MTGDMTTFALPNKSERYGSHFYPNETHNAIATATFPVIMAARVMESFIFARNLNLILPTRSSTHAFGLVFPSQNYCTRCDLLDRS